MREREKEKDSEHESNSLFSAMPPLASFAPAFFRSNEASECKAE